jgi:hypothetical protein
MNAVDYILHTFVDDSTFLAGRSTEESDVCICGKSTSFLAAVLEFQKSTP